MVRFSLVTLAGLMVGNVEAYLIGLSLGIPILSSLASPNPGAVIRSLLGSLTIMIRGMSLVNTLGCLIDYI